MSYTLSIKQVQSTAKSSGDSSSIQFGTDLNSEPAYISGVVTTSTEFAAAMNVLGNVVRLAKPAGVKDHSAYQAWVSQQYLRELLDEGLDVDAEAQKNAERLKELESTLQGLNSEATKLRSEIGKLMKPYQDLIWNAKTRYWEYLYTTNRDLWVLLDPIVSVQVDGTFFEAFSMDESVYARVFLPHSNIATLNPFTTGTTNIDFSSQLNKEFRRVRSYRPLNLTVGQGSVSIATEAQKVVEQKIPLPETWVQGLVEVQSVLSLATTNFVVSTEFISEIISKLESEVEKTGPRSLKFKLNPGLPISVEIEPWGLVLTDSTSKFNGDEEKVIRIWGRRRLSVLGEILPGTDSVEVTLLGSGMPSFWSVTNKGVELTVGLSGWSSNDWASKARFSSFIPTNDLDSNELEIIRSNLKEIGLTTASDLAKKLHLPLARVNSALQKLCLVGKAMFHPTDNTYRWRNLFPELELEKKSSISDEERLYKHLKNIEILVDEIIDSERSLEAMVDDRKVVLRVNVDGRPTYAQCNCPYFNYNKLKSGPCRHMIYTLVNMDKKHV